jgi:hypothetical protein
MSGELKEIPVINPCWTPGHQGKIKKQDPGVAAPDAALLFCKATKE